MVVTLRQQYNIGEKSTVILYTYYINRHAGTPEKQRNKKTKTSNMVVIVYCYIGCEDEVIVVSHIQRIGCQPEKTTLLHGGQSRSRSAKQGKK